MLKSLQNIFSKMAVVCTPYLSSRRWEGGVEWKGGEQREGRGSRVEGRGAEGGEGE